MRIVDFPEHIERNDILNLIKKLDKLYPLVLTSINLRRGGHRVTLRRLSGADNLDEYEESMIDWIDDY